MTSARGVVLAILCLFAFSVLAWGKPFDAAVEFSDGSAATGRFYPGSDKIKLRSPTGFHEVAWENVSEVVFTIASAWDERAWTFDEPGKTAKTFSEDFHSVVLLKAEVSRRDGVRFLGEIFSDAAKLTTPNGKTRKILLLSKLTGAPGGMPEAIIYPTRIRFASAASAASATESPASDAGAVLLAAGTLERLPARRRADGTLMVPPGAVGAVRDGSVVCVRWGEKADEKDYALIEDNLKAMNDFFDSRVLLAASPSGADDVLTLILFSRKGRTTLGAAKSQPWRLEAVMWRIDRESGRALAGTRNYLFRGIEGKNDMPPKVELELEPAANQTSSTEAVP